MSRTLVAFALGALTAIGSAYGQFQEALHAGCVADAAGVSPGGTIHMALALSIHSGWHINSNKPLESFLIPTVLTFAPSDGVTIDEIVYPKAVTKKFAFSETPMAVYEGDVNIGVAIRIADSVAPGTVTLKALLRYQACNDKQCQAPIKVDLVFPVNVIAASEKITPQNAEVFKAIAFGAGANSAPPPSPAPPQPPVTPKPQTPTPPQPAGDWKTLLDHFTISAQAGGYMRSAEFIKFIDGAESGKGYSQKGMFTGKSVIAIVFLTLLGGLALNLTPCVLPLIPITLGIIGAGARAGSKSRGFALGGLYGLGIALLYGVLGVVAIFGAATFGSINASPWFNFGIAAIFVVLALGMFDIIMIDFTKYQSKLGIKKDRGSFAFAFVMGLVNALLAGACVAPVVIAVILYAQDMYTQGSKIGLAMPFLLGIGMALPWPFAGAGLSLLPKPGKWMEMVKKAFGVFILVFAAYYGYLGYSLLSAGSAVDSKSASAGAAEAGWVSSLDEGLAQAQRENKPVLIDFWATWCKNCLVMNETTFKDTKVLEKLGNYVKIKYQAEVPDESPAKDVLSQFEYVGLPHYVILKPRARNSVGSREFRIEN